MQVWLGTGIEHGRVYANVGGVNINDPDCNVKVSVMFWFAYFSVVFYIHEIYISREETMVFDAQVLFNYAKVNTVFHSMAPLKFYVKWLIVRNTDTINFMVFIASLHSHFFIL